MILYNANNIEPDEPASFSSISSLMLVESADEPRFLALAQVDGGPWQVNDFTHLLRENVPASITIYQPEASRIPQFSMNYGAEGQQISDLMIFRGNQLWQLSGHIDESAGVVIEVGLSTVTVRSDEGRFGSLSPARPSTS